MWERWREAEGEGRRGGGWGRRGVSNWNRHCGVRDRRRVHSLWGRRPCALMADGGCSTRDDGDVGKGGPPLVTSAPARAAHLLRHHGHPIPPLTCCSHQVAPGKPHLVFSASEDGKRSITRPSPFLDPPECHPLPLHPPSVSRWRPATPTWSSAPARMAPFGSTTFA